MTINGPSNNKYTLTSTLGDDSSTSDTFELKAGTPSISTNHVMLAEITEADAQESDVSLLSASLIGGADGDFATVVDATSAVAAWFKEQAVNRLQDRGTYAVKYITTGGYPIDDQAALRAGGTAAANRGECTFLIDAKADETATVFRNRLEGYSELKAATNDNKENVAQYIGGMHFDASYFTSVYGSVRLPASFAYLSCLSRAVRDNPNWYAVAGVIRGQVAKVADVHTIATNKEADLCSPRDGVAVNCVIKMDPYGYILWGNRTLLDNSVAGDLTAPSFLNIRQLVNDLKRTLWLACRALTFEQNAEVLWVNFKSKITPTLDAMKSGNGIRDYQILKEQPDNNKRACVKARVIISPIEAVEDWDITVELADSVSTVAG